MKACRFITFPVLAALILSFFTVTAFATQESIVLSEEQSRHNIMMVIDGSGSLVSGESPTDPKGLRYDAINLFLALLTDSGNQVGAVVFDDDAQNYLLNTGISSVSGKVGKIKIAERIRNAGTRNDTDIGSALLTAVEELETAEENGLPSAIVLFSDGRTDLAGDEKAYQVSIANKEAAITRAQELKIPVYSLCLNASPVADPMELKEISDRTSGSYVAVDRPEDLAEAFELFYSLIFSSPSSTAKNYTFPPEGMIRFSVDVPTWGAEEVNLILNTQNDYKIKMHTPSEDLSEKQLQDSTMSGGPYDIVKLVDPEPGRWDVELSGDVGKEVLVNVLYNVDSTAVLRTSSGETDVGAGETVKLLLSLYQDGNEVTDTSVTREYNAVLKEENTVSGQFKEIPMKAEDSGTFSAEICSKEITSVSLVAELTCGNLGIESNRLILNFGNTPPVVTEDSEITEKVVVTPVSGRTRTFALNNIFKDKQGDKIHFDIASSQLVDGTVKIDGDTLTVDTSHSRSGDLAIKATDTQGASSIFTIHFKVTNLTFPIFITIIAIILFVVFVVLFGIYQRTHKPFNKTLTVTNISTDISATHAMFRGKRRLRDFLGVMPENTDKKTGFYVPSRDTLEFQAPQDFYVYGQRTRNIRVNSGMTIYFDQDGINGIYIEIQ